MGSSRYNKLLKAASAALALLTLLFCVPGCSGRTDPGEAFVEIGTPVPKETPAPTAESTDVPHPVPASDAPTAQPTTAFIPPITSVSGKYVSYEGTNVIRIDDRAYEVCYYVEDVAKLYADLMAYAAEKLAGTTNVWSMIIPAAYGVMVPDDMKDKVPSKIDMKECIERTYGFMPDSVHKVSFFDDLMYHRDEYIFFRTDHHWTQRGAYYAYAAFMRQKGVGAHGLGEYRSVDYGDFLGTLYNDSKNDPALLPAETITAYYPVSEGLKMEIQYASGGAFYEKPIIEDAGKFSTGSKYSIFAGGDNYFTVFTNPSVTDGSVLIVIKESFGDALMPFLADHYSKVYEIDYRLWDGNLIDFAKEVGATDMLFANSFAVISARASLGKINGILKK